MTPTLAVAAVVVDQDRLLLVRRGRGPAQGQWALPGGKVEHGEALIEAVAREVLEETALEVVCGSLVGFSERIEPDAHHVIAAFGATLIGANEPAAGDDAAEARWVKVSDLRELTLVAGLTEVLRDARVLGPGS